MSSGYGTQPARPIRWLGAALLAVAAGAFAGAARAEGQEDDGLRVLVRAERGEGTHAPLTRLATRRVCAALLARGISVVDAGLAENLLNRIRTDVDAERGAAGRTEVDAGGRGEGLEAWGNTLLEVGLRPEDERRRQGRYRVRDRLAIRVIRSDDASLLFDGTAVAGGVSFHGLLAAHRAALDRLLAAGPESLVARAAARLEALREEERQNGARFTIVVFAGREHRNPATRLAAGLRGVAGVQAGSVELVRQQTVPLGDGGKQSSAEIRLRFRGPHADLLGALLELAAGTPEGSPATAEKNAERPAVDFLATPRRIVLFLCPPARPSGAAVGLSEETGREIERLIRRLGPLDAGESAGLTATVAPAAVPASGDPDERRAALVTHLTETATAALGAPTADRPEGTDNDEETPRILVQPRLEKLGSRWVLGLALLDAVTRNPVFELSHVLAESVQGQLDDVFGS